MARTRMAFTVLAAVLAVSSSWVLAQSKAPAAAASAPDVSAFDKHYAEVQAQMQAMHAQMSQLAQTQDPVARQKLLQEHWASMQSAMQSMQGLWGNGPMGLGMGGSGMGGPGMMGGGHMGGGPGMMNWGHVRGYYHNMTPEQLRQRQYMSDQYMGMQQQMMEQMLQQQHWMLQAAPPAQGK